MKIGEYIKYKQPNEYEKLMKMKERKQEHLSFYDIKNLMEDAPVYKRGKGGALKQIR